MGIFDKLFKRKKVEKAKEIIAFESEYVEEEQDLLVLIQHNVSGAMIDGDFYKLSVPFLASVNIKTGEVSYEKGFLRWIIKKNLEKKDWGYQFDPLSICRVKVRKCIQKKLEPYCAPTWNNRYLIVEVLNNDEFHPELDRIRQEYRKPVFIDNELGHFSLDKEFNWFQGKIDWLDSKCDVQLKVDLDRIETAHHAMDILLKLRNEANDWDIKVRGFAAKKLVGLANDWQSDVDIDAEEITKKEFGRRIHLHAIFIEADGEIEFYFDDDDMFLGHTVVVYGNISGELTRADMEG